MPCAFEIGRRLSIRMGSDAEHRNQKIANRSPRKRGPGGMAEWLKAAVLKTVFRKRDVGSNPTPSARKFNVVKFHH